MSPGKMIRILSGLRRKPGRGYPFLDLSPGDGGRESLVSCLLLLEAPAIHLAAERLRRREGRCGGRTGVPGQLPASIEASAIRLAAWRLCRREGRCGGRTGVPGQLPASIEASAIRLAAWRLCRREGCRCCVAKGSLVERGTFASAAGGRKSEQKGVAVVKIL